MLEYAFENDGQLSAEHIETLNSICELMKSPAADNISKNSNKGTGAKDN
jgi:hypothetical protein